MKLLYIIKQCASPWQDNELRYSLRSVERYGKNVEDVIICGYKPEWLQNVTHAELPDPHPVKADNTWFKMRMMCHNMSSAFCLMNDDFFLLKETDFNTLPDYYDGTVNNLVERYRRVTEYVSVLYASNHVLQQNNRPQNNYAVHYPMVIHPEKMRPMFAFFAEQPGLSFRLMYGNMFAANPQPLKDLKINEGLTKDVIRSRVKDAAMFSIGDQFLNNEGKQYLEQLFHEKSKYEK